MDRLAGLHPLDRLVVAEGLPVGTWKHHFPVQTVNSARDTMDPTLAARIIGGLPVSQNMATVLDVACARSWSRTVSSTSN